VIVHAATSGWQWGRDIVFTYGPLGYLRYPVFDEALLVPLVLWNGFLVATVMVGIVGLLRPLSTAWAVALYAVIVFAASMLSGKGIYMMFPLFAALFYFREPERPQFGPIILLILAAGVFANAYVSSLVFGFSTCALMDTSRMLRRHVPLFVPVYAGAFLGAFLLAGQSLATFPVFLRSITEIAAGYADAMSTYGSRTEIGAFLGVSVAVLSIVIWCEWTRLTDAGQRSDAWLLILILGAFWYVTWKSGFVRHDLHSVIAWACLAIGVAGYAAARWTRLRSRSARWALLASTLVSSGAGAFVAGGSIGLSTIGDQAKTAIINVPIGTLRNGLGVLADPHAWIRSLQNSRESARAAMRAALPRPTSVGTVDLLGTEQAAVLAYGFDYRPQPVFQSYAAYTPWLIESNRAHLRSDHASETIFFGRETIDNRYPLLDNGKAIVELFARYKPDDVVGDYVRMRRRSAVLDAVVTEVAVIDAGFGVWVPVPESPGAVMLEATIRPSISGWLARLALRLPRVEIRVRLADGTEKAHRLVPAMAGEGFLLSPYVESAAVLASLGAGRLADLAKKRVVAVKVDTERSSARVYYADEVRLRLMRLDLPGATSDEMSPGLRRFFERYDVVTRLAQSVAGKGQVVEARGSLLFAHAPATPAITVPGDASLHASYGIFDGAWTDGRATDGVCFRILGVGQDGKSTKLHERCLTPLQTPEDRKEGEVSLRLTSAGPVKLVFETDCRANCSWDWSYWKDIDIAH
jgi:hypothetical protein